MRKDSSVATGDGAPRVSFRDKVLEGATLVQIKVPKDLIHQKLARLPLKNGDRM